MTHTPRRSLLSTFVIAALSLASPLLSSTAHADLGPNLIVNGGFEDGYTVQFPPPNGLGGTAVGGGDATWANGNMNGWTVGPAAPGHSNAIATNNSSDFATISNGDPAGGGPHSGLLAAVFANVSPADLGYITQAVATTIGQTYRFSFWVSDQLDSSSTNAPGGVPVNTFTANYGGAVVGNAIVGGTNFPTTIPVALTVPLGWTYYTTDFTATSLSTNISFTAGSDTSAVLLDDVSLVSVPEVSSFGMLTGVGLLAFGTAARFRRRSAVTA